MDQNKEIIVNLTEAAVKRRDRKIQYVIINFDDGSTASFSGPAVVNEQDQKTKRVVGVSFTEPRELPGDMKFEPINEEEQKKIVGDDCDRE